MKDELLDNNIVTLFGRGWSIRRLSSEFDISRARVKRILSRNEYKRETGQDYVAKSGKRASKLDPYKEYIKDLLETYKNTRPTYQRLFELLKEKGYDGGITILSDYVSSMVGKKKKEPIICVETSPGQRASHDWSEYYIEFTSTKEREKVIFFSFILNYSRRQYIEVVKDKSQQTLLDCLINTFMYFEAVPKELKSDNQKACVDRWELGKPIFNKKFLDFATYYRFRPLTINPRKPKENLKIERPFYYLETNFFNARSFFDKQDLKDQLLKWLQNNNDQRIHRTTRRKPIDMYKEELPYLQPLPLKQFDTSCIEYRIVNNQSCIEWDNYYYVVQNQYMFETCAVRVKDNEIIIYSPKNEEIKRYTLAEKGRKNRYIGRVRQNTGNKVSIDAKEVVQRLSAFGAVMQEYIEQIKRHKPNSFLHHLRQILSLKVNYYVEDIVVAVRRALKYKVYESRAIENFLSINAEKKNEVKLMSTTKTKNTNE